MQVRLFIDFATVAQGLLSPELRNHWPVELPSFKGTMLRYFSAADALHLDVLRAVAMGLRLPVEHFTPLCNQRHQNLRLLHYPSTPAAPASDSLERKSLHRAGEHTDYGVFLPK